MDTDMLRTFLEVTTAGSFVAAAERLHVTQSTVSTRIRQLEEQLGCELFRRTRNGATPTPAGLRFQRQAVSMLRLWEQARQEAVLPAGTRTLLRIGAEAGLWNRLLHRWIPWMRHNASDIALRCDVGLADGLIQNLQEGAIDLGLMYSPRHTPGLTVQLVTEEELVLLSMAGAGGGGGGYVHIDWSDDFRRKIVLRHPESQAAPVSIGMGTLGLEYLKQCGGTGHFPRGLVQPLVDEGLAEILPEAHPFSLPIYAVFPTDADTAVLRTAFAGLHAILPTGTPPRQPSEFPMANIE